MKNYKHSLGSILIIWCQLSTHATQENINNTHPRGGGGVLPEKVDRGVWPTSQNPYPIYDLAKNLIPYL